MAEIPAERPRSDALELGDRPFVGDIAGVERGFRFEEHHMNFFIGDGKMLDAVRHDDELALSDDRFAVAEFHEQYALCHEKHFILALVMMPDEFALKLRCLHVKIVQLPDDFGAPAIGEAAELVRKIDRVHRWLLRGFARDRQRSKERGWSFRACPFPNKFATRSPCLTRGPSPNPLRRDTV